MSESTAPDEVAGPAVARLSVRRNVMYMMSSQLFTWVLATAAAVIIPRFLGPSTLGEMRLAISLWLIAGTIAGLGTSAYLQLEVAKNQAEGLTLVGPILVIRTIAFAACTVFVAIYVLLTAGGNREFLALVLMLGIGTLVGLWSDAFGSMFIGLERMSTTAWASAVPKLVNFVAIVTVLLLGAGALGIQAVGLVTSVGGLIYLVWKFRSVSRVTFDSWGRRARFAVRNSTTFMAAGVALIVYQQIDLVVISWVADSEDLGWYGASDTLFGSLLFPSTVVMGAIFPTLGRLHKDDPARLESFVARVFAILSLLAVPIGLGTTLIAPDFAPLLYGEEFRQTGVVLAILGPVIIVTFGTILFGGTALATGRGRVWVAVMFGAAALTIPLDLVLVPWASDRFDNGAIGGALAYIVSETVQFVIGIWLIAPFLATRAVAWRTSRIIFAGVVMMTVGWPLRHLIFPIPVIVCSVVYAVAVLLLRVLGSEERAIIGNVLARSGIRNSWSG